MFRFPLFIVPGTRGQKLQRCMETSTVFLKFYWKNGRELDIINIMRLQGRKWI